MSAIKSILLHADATAASATRLQIARDLAERHAARVTALFGTTPNLEEMPYAYSAGAALGSHAQRRSAWQDEAKASLQRGSLSDGPEVDWFDVVGDSVVHAIIEEATYADLLVLGQRAPSISGGAPAGFIESVVIGSGRPALLVPHDTCTDAVGRRALVAWNGSRQAARALTGALPLLRRADEVHVVTWSRSAASAPFSHIGIDQYLQRHGIAAMLHRRVSSKHVGEDLMAMALEIHADLVVMGCYGRSRASELVLGGATRSVLGAMPVPVLMAH